MERIRQAGFRFQSTEAESIVGSASDTIDGVLDDIPTIDPADVAEAPDAPAPPVGIAGRSMIAPDNVSAVLKRLRRDGVKTVGRLVVRTDRADVVAIQGRRERDIDFGYEGGVERGDARRANQPFGTIAIADLDAKAPARLVRNAAKRYRVRERGIDYLIASHDAFNGTGHRWIAYFKNGIYVQGDERGRVIRRIS